MIICAQLCSQEEKNLTEGTKSAAMRLRVRYLCSNNPGTNFERPELASTFEEFFGPIVGYFTL